MPDQADASVDTFAAGFGLDVQGVVLSIGWCHLSKALGIYDPLPSPGLSKGDDHWIIAVRTQWQDTGDGYWRAIEACDLLLDGKRHPLPHSIFTLPAAQTATVLPDLVPTSGMVDMKQENDTVLPAFTEESTRR
jgi:hypothetical protein